MKSCNTCARNQNGFCLHYGERLDSVTACTHHLPPQPKIEIVSAEAWDTVATAARKIALSLPAGSSERHEAFIRADRLQANYMAAKRGYKLPGTPEPTPKEYAVPSWVMEDIDSGRRDWNLD